MKHYKNYPVEKYDDLKQLYHTAAEKYNEKTLIRQKQNGELHHFSYHQYCTDVDALGTELLARGMKNKRIIILGENCYHWVTAFMAVTCGVGIVVPLDKDLPEAEIANLSKTAEASLVLYSSAYEKRLSMLDPSIVRICFDEFPTLIAAGNERIIAGDRDFLDAKIDATAMSLLLFTARTTGTFKGVMLSHRNICFMLSELCQMIYVNENDRFLSLLPLNHMYECVCGFLCPLSRGADVTFCNALHHMSRDMRDVRPTVMLCVPLLMETMYKKVWNTIRKNALEKRVKTLINMTNSIPSEKVRLITKKKIFAKILQNFGGEMRMMLSCGAAINPDVLKGLRDFGIAAYQGYTLTECAPLAAINRDTCYNDASAGMATPNTLLDVYDVQDDGVGEIRIKGENVTMGYYNMPELNAKVFRNGWFYTGDLGYIDNDGFLFITGRKKNVITSSSGKFIFPEELEAHLDRNAFIKESIVVGYANTQKKDYDIVAIIHPDYKQIEELYGKNFSGSQLDLELQKAVSEVNSALPSYKRIAYYVIRNTEFPKNSSRKIKRIGLADEAFEDYKKQIEN